MASNAHAEERQHKKVIYIITNTLQLSLLYFFYITSLDTAKIYKLSVSCCKLECFLLLCSTTCTKLCCKNLVTEFSQVFILNSLNFVLLILNRKTFLKAR